MTTNTQFSDRPVLRLIHGGSAQSPDTRHQSGSDNVEVKVVSKPAQEERLRQTILRLTIDDIGQTVDDTLREINQKLDSESEEDYARCVLIRRHLKLSGLEYMVAADHMNLEGEGYLLLSNAKRLVAKYPQLALLRPEDNDLLTMGELPTPPVKGTLMSTTGSNALLTLRNPTTAQCNGEASVRGYFDKSDNSRSALESNRLRRAILSIRLTDVKRTVKDALSDLCMLREPTSRKQRERGDELRRSLEAIGLAFQAVDEEMGLPIRGYITLAWADRLLGRHPELAGLHPAAWPALRIA